MCRVTKLVSDLSVAGDTALNDMQISQLQMLDRMCQSLSDLSIISQVLASGQTCMSDQSARLQLPETRAILSTDCETNVAAAAGSVELF
ncbi:hypothetical protein KUV51_06310 [Tateyamaria omphalii]|uniref:hypothetical protein n=1 Tax=Tateyamaria omphalii TaxID=299262 RepID=UPI001C9A125A|nr:hypothetical protein [Tateyamaria omphalii]MBY5932607.1 hypothetical protein [Tateyamaria omphalii]